MKSYIGPFALVLVGLAAGGDAAADAGCTAVAKAAQAALAQPRIHAAIDSPLDPEALKMGFKQRLMHSIVIDQVQYSNAIRAGFSRTALDSKEMRMLASDLGPFLVETAARPPEARSWRGATPRSTRPPAIWAAVRCASSCGSTRPAACRCVR